MFGRVLVANRGEIACRVLSTLRERGIESVAVYSDVDAGAPHTQLADQAIRIGPAEPQESYLNADAILAAASASGADAIHPGYGFLAENAGFAQAVERAGLTFIGPTPEQVRDFGDKRRSRDIAGKAGLPIIPGYEIEDGADADELSRGAEQLGYPVLVKAALGGGGKGMQIVANDGELSAAVASATRIGAAAFGDPSVYLERALESPRHIEVQILGDGNGNVIHLFERECSLQRRHQKVIEETPSPGITQETREGLWAAAVQLGKAINYRGAGTVEFLVDEDEQFYFLEMNTRLQVEHPVTEWVAGIDLVWMQLQVASVGSLPIQQDEIRQSGHAVEARLYAEDPDQEFLPQAGTLSLVSWPQRPFVRIDSGVVTGSEVPVHYDPILAKISCWGENRMESLNRLSSALQDTVAHGVATNINLLRDLTVDSNVRTGNISTTYLEDEFLEQYLNATRKADPPVEALAAAVSMAGGGDEHGSRTMSAEKSRFSDPFARLGQWRQPGLSGS